MWAYIKDGAIKQTNTVQTRLEINPGSYFPAKYANEWTKEQKEAYGVYEVVVDKTNYKDENYYINTDSTYTFSGGVVKETWGTATARKLGDTNWTQEEIDAGKVRTKAADMHTKIDAADTVEKLAALYVYTGDPLTRPLGEWPDPVE